MPWKWYGVKTLYRTRATGRPRIVDDAYDAAATLVEERVVLVRARNFDEAIAKAEAEARSYAASGGGSYRNRYGQRVTQRYLGACDAFELFDPPGAGREIYSQTEIVSAEVSDDECARRRLGSERRPSRSRVKFFNAELGRRKRC